MSRGLGDVYKRQGKKPVVEKKGKKAVGVKKQKALVGRKAAATKKPAAEKPAEKKPIMEGKKPAARAYICLFHKGKNTVDS